MGRKGKWFKNVIVKAGKGKVLGNVSGARRTSKKYQSRGSNEEGKMSRK